MYVPDGRTTPHQHACTTLRELSLHWDNDGFNAHLQHHHTILLGDLVRACVRKRGQGAMMMTSRYRY